MKMKKIFAILIAIVSACMIFVSCADSQEHKGESPVLEEVNVLPTMEFENETIENNSITIDTTNKTRIILPDYIAKDFRGNVLPVSNIRIRHSLNGKIDDSVTYNAGSNSKTYYEVGRHIFTFELTDTENSNLKSYYNVFLNVYQSIFQTVNMDAVLENELSDHPTYRSITSSYALNYFDMNKGKVYYAEAVFDSVDKAANNGMSWAIGMLHATDTDGRYALRDYYRIEDNGEKWSHHYVYGWTPDCVVSSDYYKEQGYPDWKFSEPGEKIKIAVARVGEVFYSFINDELTDKFVYSGLNDRSTCAGVLMLGNDITPYPGKISDMYFVTGDEAEAKVQELESSAKYYQDFGYARVLDGHDTVTFTENSFEFKKTENFSNRWWDVAVKANVAFAGKSKVEFDYELTNAPNGAGTVRMYVKQLMGTSDPTNSEGFYNGLQLRYSNGALIPQTAVTEVYKKHDTDEQWDHFPNKEIDFGENFVSEKAKFHIEIMMEPLNTDGKTKFTYTITQTETGKEVTFSEFATQEALNYVSEDEVNDFYHITFMTENLEFKVSNLQCTSYKVL